MHVFFFNTDTLYVKNMHVNAHSCTYVLPMLHRLYRLIGFALVDKIHVELLCKSDE